eukprot:TRINITY_DN1828_c0_g1_i5.p1 TRINITY_DN1828_c0_g1~~TRINITY_DN1828_c0_g1_i5.p1  ORF type:complete len:436 (+),score=170.84 TRINITY_DN1828_c0_g1_i5:83-1309(+)
MCIRDRYQRRVHGELHHDGEDITKKLKLQIQVNNWEESTIYMWDTTKFMNRYYIIKELLEKYFETNQVPVLSKNEGPFWDPKEPLLIGQAYIKLTPLAYLLDNHCELALVNEKGQVGTLEISVYPTDEEGSNNLADDNDLLVENPKSLVGSRLDYLIFIDNAKIPDDFSDTYCEFQVMNEKGEIEKFKTKTIYGKDCEPIYREIFHMTYKSVEEKHINYLMDQNLCVKVYGFPEPSYMGLPPSMTHGASQMEALIRRLSHGSGLDSGSNEQKSHHAAAAATRKDESLEDLPSNGGERRGSEKRNSGGAPPRRDLPGRSESLPPMTPNEFREQYGKIDKKGGKKKDDCTIFQTRAQFYVYDEGSPQLFEDDCVNACISAFNSIMIHYIYKYIYIQRSRSSGFRPLVGFA